MSRFKILPNLQYYDIILSELKYFCSRKIALIKVENMLLKDYKILTLTHRNTKLKELSAFMLSPNEGEELAHILSDLKAAFGIEELLYLSTCNRVMYFMHTTQDLDKEFIARFFTEVNPELSQEIAGTSLSNVDVYEGKDAIAHLFDVAASVDSLVVGEREIVRQLRDAYRECLAWGLTGDNIRLAIQYAVESAKQVYSQTRIGEKPISVVSLAIQKLLQTNLSKDARILLIGAGQTNTLVAKFLRKHQFENVTVFNRSLDKAEELAKINDAKAFALTELGNYQGGFDCMIVCTGATSAIVNPALYKSLLQKENTVEKVVIDLAIPNNVDKKIVDSFAVNYIEIENLKALAKENLSFRVKEVSKAKIFLSQNLSAFHEHYQQRQITRALKDVPIKIKAVKAHAMNQVFKKDIACLNSETRDLLERMMSYMEKQCISIPMKAAKESILVKETY